MRESKSQSRDKSSKGYHKLILWQKAREFVKQVYKFTEKFPKSEEYGLKGQLRRAAVSVVLNIVEGYRRKSTKEFLRFLNVYERDGDLHCPQRMSHEEIVQMLAERNQLGS